MLGVGAGVVIEPAQRVIDAGGAKQRQRLGRAGLKLERAVGDGIVHGGQIRHVERIAQRSRHGRVLAGGDGSFDVDVAAIGEVDGDRLAGLADFDGHAVVLDQQPDLLGEIGPEQIRPGHAGFVHAGPGDETIGQTRVEPRMRRGRDADKWIVSPRPRRDRLAADIGFEPVAQEFGVALVDLFETGDGRSRVGKGFGGDGGRRLHGSTADG